MYSWLLGDTHCSDKCRLPKGQQGRINTKMRENDCSPDLNDLNTLSLQDYEKIIEKNAHQRLSSVSSSPTASWACFPPFEDSSTLPDYLMHNFISSEPSPFFPDLPFLPDYSSLLPDSSAPQNHDPVVLPPMTEYPEPLCSLPIFPQSRSLSTSPELRTPGESGTDTTPRGSHQKTTKEKVPRHKRPSHINAEHRRRSKIQRCLEDLKTLVPSASDASSSSGPSGKKSKASLLFRTAGYCRQLKADCRELQKEADALRTELQSLSAEINTYHTELPADGIQGQVTSSITTQQMFNNYVYARTATNWKFWIFGLFIRPLFESYDSAVVTTNCDDFCRSLLKWLQDHCNLLVLRKAIHNAVFHVARRTSVINLPENLPKEAMEAAIKDVNGVNGQSPTQTSENGLYDSAHLR